MSSPQNTPAAPQNNPASAPGASSLTWRYPFPAKDGNEVTDPQIFYGALGAMSDGYFPLGVNGLPHGGVHFGASSASRVDQSRGVRVIADGDIVAYKLDDTYAHLQFTKTRHWALYSTGFVLVRHKMTMPAAPGSTDAQPADETLTFFSLYMHMADWSTYLADGRLDLRPGWWPGVTAFRIGAKDKQVGGGAHGAFVSTAPTAGRKGRFTAGKHVGFLPEGCEITIDERRGQWGHISAITSGTMIAPTSGDYFGWEDGPQAPWLVPDGVMPKAGPDERRAPDSVKETRTPLTSGGDWGWIYLPEQHATREPTGVGTLVIPAPENPIHVKAGTLLGQLGEYIDYETSTPLPPVPGRQLLHLEVFAGEALKTFIEKSRTRAAHLPQSERTILAIEPGANLVAKPADADLRLGDGVQLARLTLTDTSPKTGPWIQVQPWISGSSGHAQKYQGAVWIQRRDLARLDSPNGLSAWKSFPLSVGRASSPVNPDLVVYPRAELNSLGDGNVAVDENGVTWWRIEVGTDSGQVATGWICGGKSDGTGNQAGTRWESPWAWPGFEIVDATGIKLTDAFRRNLSVTGSASPEEQKMFVPSTEAVAHSALLLKLERTVSRLPSSGGVKKAQDKDEGAVVTAVRLRQALGRRWLASELGHVILKYESEWGGSISRWEALTPLMRNAAENWKCELQRIGKLLWWDAVKGKVDGFPVSPVVNHIHPIALIGNFACACGCINVERFIELYATQHQNFAARTQPLDVDSKANLERYLRLLLEYYKKFKGGECNISYLAYILATARHETAKYHKDINKTIYFAPTAEGGPIAYFDRYDPVLASTQAWKTRARSMENTRQGDGYTYRGRGYVQLTWKKLYRRAGQALGVELVDNPDKAMEPPIAAAVAAYGMEVGLFTGKKLSDYIDDSHQDYFNARRIINGLDCAEGIAGYAVRFKEILESCKC